MSRHHENPLWVDTEFLREIGSYDAVFAVLQRSEWPGLLTLRSHADKEDTAEFLSSFHYIGQGEDEGFAYLHRGVQRQTTLDELRAVFGWSQGTQTTYDLTNHPQFWVRLTGGRSAMLPSEGKAREFVDPAMFYLQFMISRILFARKNGGDKPSRLDLAVIGAFVDGIVPDFAHFLCLFWSNIHSGGRVCCGGIVTYMLRQLHGEADHAQGILLPVLADRQRFISGRHIRVRPTGELRWHYYVRRHSGDRPGPPPGAAQAAAPGRLPALPAPPPQQHPPPPQFQHQAGPSAPPQADDERQVATIFNMQRLYFIQGPMEFLQPPPGWRIGDPIPPEYQHPTGPPGHGH